MDSSKELLKKIRLSAVKRDRILIVDDKEDVCEYLHRSLEHFGYKNTQVCTDAEEALEVLKEGKIALALLDLRMPGKGGLWMLEQLGTLSSDTAAIVVSASREFEDVREALNRGAESYISKPLQMEELNHTVSGVLEKRYLTRDPETSLPKRSVLIEALAAGEDEDFSGFEGLALVLIENAGELESVYGPAVADEIVKQLASRIRKALGKCKSIICRINTYQMGFVLADTDEKDIEELLQKLALAFHQPFDFSGISIHIDGRIGFSKIKGNESDPELHLREAEFALRRASGKKWGWAVYDSIQDSGGLKMARESLELLGELKNAMDEGQISFHYQPKICLESGTLNGVEALMRWQHPTRGNIPPDKFIPRAEQSTLINTLTEFAVKESFAQAKRWKERGLEVPVSVNISRYNLLQPDFPDMIERYLELFNIKEEMLELEVTERALMWDIEYISGVLNTLREKGIVISIDDFGTGYTSLNYMIDLPADIIKIDKSFVQTLNSKKGSARVVEIATDLAHHQGKKVAPEGVEETETLKFLADTGCDIAQGYLFGMPQTAGEFGVWYENYPAHISRLWSDAGLGD